MAQYVSDMSAGNPLTRDPGSSGDTVSLVSSPSNIGGQALQVELGSSSHMYLGTFGAVPTFTANTNSSTDFEILALVRISSIPPRRSEIGLYGSSSGWVSRITKGETQIILGGSNETSAGLGFSIADSTYYWHRLRKRGSTLYGQAWAYGNSEPSGEAHSHAVTGTVSSGKVIWIVIGSGTYHLDWISVGTAGDPAPRSKLTEFHVRDGGLWKPVQDLSVRDGGVWKPVQEYHVRDAGLWKKVYG